MLSLSRSSLLLGITYLVLMGLFFLNNYHINYCSGTLTKRGSAGIAFNIFIAALYVLVCPVTVGFLIFMYPSTSIISYLKSYHRSYLMIYNIGIDHPW